MSDISPLLYLSRVSATSNTILFSLIIDPFEIESKSDFLSVSRRGGSFRSVRVDSSLDNVNYTSNISL